MTPLLALLLVSSCAPNTSSPNATGGSPKSSSPENANQPTPIGAESGETTTPILVELFSSEGCSSCPPAEKALGEVLANPPPATRVLAIELHVDYWDRLGHTDVFASPAYTERQKAYATKIKGSSVYTPQAVIDGQQQLVGSRKADLIKAIVAAAARPHMRVSVARARGNDGSVTVQTAPIPSDFAPARVMLAQVQRHLSTQVSTGENAGATLEHTWVATNLVDLGEAEPQGSTRQFGPVTLDADHAVLAWVALRDSGAIVGSGDLTPP